MTDNVQRCECGRPIEDRPALEQAARDRGNNVKLAWEYSRLLLHHQAALEMLLKSRRNHYSCDDTWYNCPLAEEGTINPSWEDDECICGAEEWNAKLDALLAKDPTPPSTASTPESTPPQTPDRDR